MKVTGTKQAFMELISGRGFAAKHGYPRSTVANWKDRAAAGTMSLDKMEEVLSAHGGKVVQEKVWELS